MRRLSALFAVLVVSALALAGCSKSNTAKAAAYQLTQSGNALSLSGPASFDGGVMELHFTNRAQNAGHVQIVKATGNHSIDEALKIIGTQGGPIPSWLSPVGGSDETPPGQTSVATFKVANGSYYLVGQANANDGPSPAPSTKLLTVSGGGGTLPSADKTITAVEYRFQVPALKAGQVKVRLQNSGKELHHLQTFPILPGKTISDVKTALESQNFQGPPPIDFTAGQGTATIDKGGAIVTTLNLKAGKYAFVCFLHDRAGGPPHFTQGMLQEITVG